jgi:hypothetical protein
VNIIVFVSPSCNPVGGIGSRNPANVYDGNRLSLPILRQKMVQSCGLMYVVLPDGYCYGDQNTLNTFSVSEQKIKLNNHITNNRMNQNEQKKQK